MKTLLIVVAVVVVLVAGAVFYVGSNLDSIVQSAIENIGTEMLGVEVSVGGVELALKEGRGSIRGFEIANPPGYSRSPAFAIDELTLKLDFKSGAIQLIRAGAPEIRVETKGETNNFEALLGGLAAPAPADESEVQTEDGEPLQLTIDKIEIEAANATLISDDGSEPTELSIQALTFTNLSGTAEEITSQVIRQLLTTISDAVKQAVREAAHQAVETKKGEVKENARQSLRDKLKGKD